MPLYFAVGFNNMTRALVGEKTITRLCSGIDCTFHTESTFLQQTRIVGDIFLIFTRRLRKRVYLPGKKRTLGQ